MLTREQFYEKISAGVYYLDGATGSNLQKAGMPRGCCTEQWILEHPQALISLQEQYAQAGCQILYAPTFQAQPLALQRVGLAHRCQEINAQLVALSKAAGPECLIAGDMATLAGFTDSSEPGNFELLVENYRSQIQGLMQGGADLLVAETLMYPQEAEAVLTAAELEGAGAVLYSFVLTADGAFYSGAPAGPVLRELEAAGAAAVGFNCVNADAMTPALVARLRQHVQGPLLCKPNAGNPVIGPDGLAQYDLSPAGFAAIMAQCRQAGANLLGGCCGTTPEHLAAMTKILSF